MILCSNPKAQYQAYQEEIDDAIARVCRAGWYILGKEVETLEQEFAQYLGVSRGVGVGSGTAALQLALNACGVEEGDEVITVSHTAVATACAIINTGARPVFVDIEPDFFTMDPDKIEAAITPKTKAIVTVHLYGQSADLDPILAIAQKHHLRIIEDCAQAHGATYKNKRLGSFGEMACFSFYPTKNLGALGDGGIVVTDNTALADKATRLRQYGWDKQRVSLIVGQNSRLDEIQAAVLRVKLKYLNRDNARRRGIAEKYNQALHATDVCLPQTRLGCNHAYHLYVLRTRKRDNLLSFLHAHGIGAAIHYPTPVHQQPAYIPFHTGEDMSQTTRIAQEVLSLPIYPELSNDQVLRVTEAVKCFFEEDGDRHDQ